MLTPPLASGSSKSTMAPGLFWVASTNDVLSLPDGATCCLPNTKKRVVLLASSSIFSASTCKSNSSAARLLAIAAANVPSLATKS